MEIRALFFDFGGTLARALPPSDDPDAVWLSVAPKFGISLAENAVARARTETDRIYGPRIYDYVGRTAEYWHLYDAAIMDKLGIDEHRDELEASLSQVFNDPSRIQAYPEAVAALKAIRPRVPHLGVVSNHHDRLLVELRDLGLDRFFDSVTYSQEAGAEKPAPAIFQRALARAGCAPSAAIHVGDSYPADVEGARRVGITPVWLAREGGTPPSECPTIRDLSELSAVVDRLGSGA